MGEATDPDPEPEPDVQNRVHQLMNSLAAHIGEGD